MKLHLKKTLILTGILMALSFQSCHVGRFFIYNFADIKDYKKFPSTKITKASVPFQFIDGRESKAIKIPEKITKTKNNKNYNFAEALEDSKSVAFIVIRNDSILYEWYKDNYSDASIVPSFSMAKSYVSALIGIAIDEGKIKNTSESITNYLDYLDKAKFSKITIQHLLDMRSGIKNNESYINPFGDVAKYYYGTNLKKYMKHLKIGTEPGKEFDYISVNTQLLGLIIEKATGKSVTEYLQEKIWSRIGTEFDASWSIDSKKHQTEKLFCCLNARAKDYAKFGRLYLHKGNWQGQQIISEKWVTETAIKPNPVNDFGYANQWWHTSNYTNHLNDTLSLKMPFKVVTYTDKNGTKYTYVKSPTGHFHAEGILGQFIYVVPDKNIIMVRLGSSEGWINWWEVFPAIADKN